MATLSRISDYLDGAERRGQLNVSIDDIAGVLPALSRSALIQSLQRQQARGRVIRLSRGADHWVIVPLQYAESGSPPLEIWLDQFLSKTLKLPYYVSLLSAAETYGAAPFAVMITHIVVRKARRAMRVGRHHLVFVTNIHIDNAPTQWHESPEGRFRVSTPEMTALDLVRRESLVGGMARVREVLNTLFNQCSVDGFQIALMASTDLPSVQRLGALLQLNERHAMAQLLEHWLSEHQTRLVPLETGSTSHASDVVNTVFKVRLPKTMELANS